MARSPIYHFYLRIAPPKPTASIRITTEQEDIGPLAGELLPEIWQYLQGLNTRPEGPPFIRYHAFEEPPFDLEIGFPVFETVAGEGRIAPSELPGGFMAVTWHVGPYETAVRATGILRSWIETQGWREAGAPWDVFVTNPQLEPNPERFRTEVLWPVALKGG